MASEEMNSRERNEIIRMQGLPEDAVTRFLSAEGALKDTDITARLKRLYEIKEAGAGGR